MLMVLPSQEVLKTVSLTVFNNYSYDKLVKVMIFLSMYII